MLNIILESRVDTLGVYSCSFRFCRSEFTLTSPYSCIVDHLSGPMNNVLTQTSLSMQSRSMLVILASISFIFQVGFSALIWRVLFGLWLVSHSLFRWCSGVWPEKDWLLQKCKFSSSSASLPWWISLRRWSLVLSTKVLSWWIGHFRVKNKEVCFSSCFEKPAPLVISLQTRLTPGLVAFSVKRLTNKIYFNRLTHFVVF